MNTELTNQETNPGPHYPPPSIKVANGGILPDMAGFVSHDAFVDAAMHAAGTQSRDFAIVLLNQLARGQGKITEATEPCINAAIAALSEFRCQDPTEALLAVHILCLSSQSLQLLAEAARMSHPDLQKSYYHLALKLSRAFESMVEAFRKYRRGGEQKITVQRVDVHNGAQAIVGNVRQGG